MSLPSIKATEGFKDGDCELEKKQACKRAKRVCPLWGRSSRFWKLECRQTKSVIHHLTCCRLGVDEIVVAIWRGVSLGDSKEEFDEQFDCELWSNWWWLKMLSDLHSITGETSFNDGMAEACDVTDAYEYSKGFVIAMSEFRISGVRGVVDPKSTPSNGGVDRDVLKLYIFTCCASSFTQKWLGWESSFPPCCGLSR